MQDVYQGDDSLDFISDIIRKEVKSIYTAGDLESEEDGVKQIKLVLEALNEKWQELTSRDGQDKRDVLFSLRTIDKIAKPKGQAAGSGNPPSPPLPLLQVCQ